MTEPADDEPLPAPDAVPAHAAGTVLDVQAPVLDDDLVTGLLARAWNVTATLARPLGSERDVNLLVDGGFVLKVSNPAEDPAAIDMENAAMIHAAAVSPDLPLPRLVPTVSGDTVTTVQDRGGRTCLARLITVLPGAPVEGRPVTVTLAEQIGALTARATLALQGFFHPAGNRVLDWDVRRAPHVLADPDVLQGLDAAGRGQERDAEPAQLGRRIAAVLPRLAAATQATASLPAGLNHADVTLTNILADGIGDEADGGGEASVCGLIDFGDMHHTPHICDLAVTMTSVLRNTADSQGDDLWLLAAAVLDGYQRHRPLTFAEVDVLGDLVLARLGLTLAISHRRAAAHQDNLTYISQYDTSTRRVLTTLLDLGPDAVTHRLHTLAGTVHAPTSAPPTPERGTLLQRRRAVTGGALSPLFYSEPLHIVRGQGPWLYSSDGTRYLDAYNNVAVVGHAHPTVAHAVSRQLAALNTHSRYLHRGIVELAERLLATMPDGLDTILFTTSGTEANELAWRMATAHTGGNAAVIAEHAYHGSSRWMADLSSNEWPPGYQPDHVATFPAPRTGSGADRDQILDRHEGRERITAAASRLAERGDRPALVLADLGFTSEGILDAPAAFVAGLVDGTHSSNALFLADEVQSGFGRVGPSFWRFAVAGITPDFVTLGKPMGNGYPIGALITRREIADSLGRAYEYFSTFAASPAAAAAGLAVLDVLHERAIPDRTARVGEHLRRQLRQLSANDDRLGAVRGTGLIAGIDIHGPVPDADPADRRSYARRLLDALVGEQVLAGLTGPDGTVLKIRPPLIWTEHHADRFTAGLQNALARLERPGPVASPSTSPSPPG